MQSGNYPSLPRSVRTSLSNSPSYTLLITLDDCSGSQLCDYDIAKLSQISFISFLHLFLLLLKV